MLQAGKTGKPKHRSNTWRFGSEQWLVLPKVVQGRTNNERVIAWGMWLANMVQCLSEATIAQIADLLNLTLVIKERCQNTVHCRLMHCGCSGQWFAWKHWVLAFICMLLWHLPKHCCRPTPSCQLHSLLASDRCWSMYVYIQVTKPVMLTGIMTPVCLEQKRSGAIQPATAACVLVYIESKRSCSVVCLLLQ